MIAIDFRKLRDPFPESDIRWRVQQSGISDGEVWATVMAYLTNRAIQQRLDDICGPDRWCNEYARGPEGGVVCGISILVDDGEWVTKWDGGENTDVDAVKGGLSDAMKRSAVQWGIGRYLYGLGVGEARIVPKGTPGAKSGKIKSADGGKPRWFSWLPPSLPTWALPPEIIDERYVRMITADVEALTLDAIHKAVKVVDGDTSINRTTRDHVKSIFREAYKRKKESANGRDGAGEVGVPDAGSAEGLPAEQPANAA